MKNQNFNIEKIKSIIPESHNMWDASEKTIYAIASQWASYGFSFHEVWDWAIMGYTNPNEVYQLKQMGYDILNIHQTIKTICEEKFANVADVSIDEDGKKVYINHIEVFEKEKGIGTAILNTITFLADTMKKNVYLTATDSLGSDLNRLLRFYERFGFQFKEKQWENTLYYMVREKY